MIAPKSALVTLAEYFRPKGAKPASIAAIIGRHRPEATVTLLTIRARAAGEHFARTYNINNRKRLLDRKDFNAFKTILTGLDKCILLQAEAKANQQEEGAKEFEQIIDNLIDFVFKPFHTAAKAVNSQSSEWFTSELLDYGAIHTQVHPALHATDEDKQDPIKSAMIENFNQLKVKIIQLFSD